MTEREIYINFKLYYPRLYERAIDITKISEYELIVKLEDGSFISYYDIDKSFRNVSEDDLETEEKCKHEFGINLRRRMDEHYVTQEELSNRTGIKQSVISLYCNGKRTPGYFNLRKILRALDCSLEDLTYSRKE